MPINPKVLNHQKFQSPREDSTEDRPRHPTHHNKSESIQEHIAIALDKLTHLEPLIKTSQVDIEVILKTIQQTQNTLREALKFI